MDGEEERRKEEAAQEEKTGSRLRQGVQYSTSNTIEGKDIVYTWPLF